MSRRAQWAIVAAVALAALAAGIYFGNERFEAPAREVVEKRTDGGIFAANFPDMQGRPQAFEQWRGKVVVVNFWATWCPPCRTEVPDFIKVQDKLGARGLVIVGLAIDNKDKVAAFADEMGINYPLLIGDTGAMDLAKSAGNRLGGLPFTVILDRAGRIAASEIGGLTAAKLEQLVTPLL